MLVLKAFLSIIVNKYYYPMFDYLMALDFFWSGVMFKVVISIIIIASVSVLPPVEYIEIDCEHECECETSHTCACEPCSSFSKLFLADVIFDDEYSDFTPFVEVYCPVFLDQECFNGIDHVPRIS